jgi:hypothetical protein
MRGTNSPAKVPLFFNSMHLIVRRFAGGFISVFASTYLCVCVCVCVGGGGGPIFKKIYKVFLTYKLE